jgi:iron complex transport system permease protein
MAPVEAEPQLPATVVDYQGEQVTITSIERIVSLNGDITEIIFALGMGEYVVGVDSSATYPPERTKTLPNIGYQRRLSAEGILSLNPTLVIGDEAAGPPETLAQIRAAGVPLAITADPPSLDAPQQKIRFVAQALGIPQRGERLAARVEAEIAAARDLAQRIANPPHVLFLYLRGTDVQQVAGRNTPVDVMIAAAGGINAAADAGIVEFKPLSPEVVIAAQPDVLLVLDKGLESVGGVDGLLKIPGLADTPAGRQRQDYRSRRSLSARHGSPHRSGAHRSDHCLLRCCSGESSMSAAMTITLQRIAGWRRTGLLPALILALAVAVALGAGIGPVVVPPDVMLAILLRKTGILLDVPVSMQQEAIFWTIRLPRVALGVLAGAALAVSGALLQGVFRNPLADPGLIGVSSGAALGAVAVIVLGISSLGLMTLPLAAFLTGTATTFFVYRLAQRHGRTDVATLLLVGLALNAMAGAATGLLTYLADDAQLRSIVFWTMGGLGGALWETVLVAAPWIGVSLALAPRLGRALNLFALGETEARHLGIEIEQVKRAAILLSALATGTAVALVGPIGFIGLIVPHIVRLIAGPDHRLLLPACALGGASLLVLADLLARTMTAPAEVPVGLITACAGGPFFLALILRARRQYGWG